MPWMLARMFCLLSNVLENQAKLEIKALVLVNTSRMFQYHIIYCIKINKNQCLFPLQPVQLVTTTIWTFVCCTVHVPSTILCKDSYIIIYCNSYKHYSRSWKAASCTKRAALYSASKALQNGCTADVLVKCSSLKAIQQPKPSRSGLQNALQPFEALYSDLQWFCS